MELKSGRKKLPHPHQGIILAFISPSSIMYSPTLTTKRHPQQPLDTITQGCDVLYLIFDSFGKYSTSPATYSFSTNLRVPMYEFFQFHRRPWRLWRLMVCLPGHRTPQCHHMHREKLIGLPVSLTPKLSDPANQR